MVVACIESGIKGKNPMGVRSCYRSKNNGRFDAYACITIGVHSLSNRKRHGSWRQAFARYNNHPDHKVAYAKKALRLMIVITRNK